ncbi:MAG: type II toxin-antitoxin system prevent-host-death family antitoxin [Burkholderiaceae bacterium]
MKTISVAEAKNRLSELIVLVEAGEEFFVTRHGKPVARLVAAGEEVEATDRRARVVDAMRGLARLRRGVTLDGDLKSIAREGLD